MNVVLVGCGAMSKAWLDAAREVPEIAVVGLVDLDADRAKARRANMSSTASPSARTSTPFSTRPSRKPCSTWSFPRRAVK